MISLLIKNKNFFFKNNSIEKFLHQWNNSSDVIKLTTSGSTSKPKIIYGKKEHLIESAKRTGMFLHLNPGSTALCCLPIEFIAGKMMIIRALVLNLTLYYVTPSFSSLKYLNFPIDFCAAIPPQVNLSLNKISLIKNLIIGGAAVSLNLKKQLFSLQNCIYESFSMTETYSHFALKKISQEYIHSDYFHLLDGFSIAQDKRNCLIIYTPFFDCPVITNDIVKIKKQKFKFLGRADFIINSAGIKIHPEEIENEIRKYTNISNEFIIHSLYDQELGEKLVLIIEEKFISDKSKFDILNKLKKYLPKYKVPKDIVTVKKFKRTTTGKIIRKV